MLMMRLKKVDAHLNDLRTFIQDETNFVKMGSVEEAYLYALSAKEMLTNKQEHRHRERGGRFQSSKGRSYGESSRSNNSMQDKGRCEWKNEEKGKTEWKGGNAY